MKKEQETPAGGAGAASIGTPQFNSNVRCLTIYGLLKELIGF
jgi:hypothetical protein